MERADKTRHRAPPLRAGADRATDAAAQRQANDALNQSPRCHAQRVQVDGIRDSPRLVAQRAQLDSVRHAGPLTVTAPATSAGLPLPQVLQCKFESSLGADLSGVRLHTGTASQDSAKSIGAQAYAIGQDIHFAPGRYDPGSPSGEHLLAHEVAHTVQQGGGAGATAQTQLEVGDPGDALEAEADKAADAMTTGRPGSVSVGATMASPKIQRKVGFELEDRDWRAYLDEKDGIRPAKRQERLARGTGFDLEADDTMGPKLPSLEFVTVPFEPTEQGIGDLNTAFHQIRGIAAHIGAFAPIPNPFAETDRVKPPKQKAFLRHKQHGLNPDLLLAGGVPEPKFKMQATQGVSLEDLPTVMKTFGSNAPGETVTEKAERDPARELLYGPPKHGVDKNNKSASDLFAAAPSLAVQVVDALRTVIFPQPEPKEDRKEKKYREPKREKKLREKKKENDEQETQTTTLPLDGIVPHRQTLLEAEDDDLPIGEMGQETKTEFPKETEPEQVPFLETNTKTASAADPETSKLGIQSPVKPKFERRSSPRLEPKVPREKKREHKIERKHRRDPEKSLLLTPSGGEKDLRRFFGDETETLLVNRTSDPLGDTGRLVGFLSMVMLYVKLLATLNPGGQQVKYMLPFLARTSFPSLFGLLPIEQQKLIRSNFDEFMEAICKVGNAKQFIVSERFDPQQGQVPVLHDANYSPTAPLVRHADFGLTGLTLGAWLAGIVNGFELLNPAAISRFLKSNSKVPVNALESFAVLGRESLDPSTVTDDEDIKGHSRLGIFENRMIAGPSSFFSAPKAHEAALNYLTYYKNLKDSRGMPGAFPNLGMPQEVVEEKKKKSKKGKK